MAAILTRELGATATIVPGGRGEFSIWLDGRKVYAKGGDDDFPDEAEVLAAARARP